MLGLLIDSPEGARLNNWNKEFWERGVWLVSEEVVQYVKMFLPHIDAHQRAPIDEKALGG